MITKKRFYNKISRIIEWQTVLKIMRSHLRQNHSAAGRPAYPILKMFKAMLLQVWHNLSDREMGYALNDRISFREFSGFYSNAHTPSYSTICRFRNNLIKSGLDSVLFSLINSYLEKHGLITKNGITIDSTIIRSSRRPRKTINIDTQGNNTYYSADEDAAWTAKASKYYYGYKLHMSADIEHDFIIDGNITPANCADTTEMLSIVKKVPLRRKALILADKGYCSTKNRLGITKLGYLPGIMFRTFSNKILDVLKRKFNRWISSIRGSVERAFGTLKRGYGFYRTKFLGISKVTGQFFIAAIAFNLKKAVSFITN